MKFIDIDRFGKIAKQVSSSKKEENIAKQYTILYIFKILRLIILAVIIAYFTGCFWYMFCENVTFSHEHKHQITLTKCLTDGGLGAEVVEQIVQKERAKE